MDNRTNAVSRIILVVALSVLPLGSAALSGDDPEIRVVEWLSYREAKARALNEDKPVLIHFTAPWCKWCKEMKKETYTDPQVIRYLGENFQAAMVDTEKLPALARKYSVDSLPTLWFLDSSGRALTSIEGMVGPEKLLRVLEFISTKAYEEIDYNSWLNKRRTR